VRTRFVICFVPPIIHVIGKVPVPGVNAEPGRTSGVDVPTAPTVNHVAPAGSVSVTDPVELTVTVVVPFWSRMLVGLLLELELFDVNSA
jgi:hypothetical protein